MITYSGHHATPTEYAKLMIEERGTLSEDWRNDGGEVDFMTEKEKDNIDIHLERQLERVRKFLGFWNLREKVFAREDISSSLDLMRSTDTMCTRIERVQDELKGKD